MTRRVVVQILPALDAGGVERCTLETARALVAAGHRSIVVSSGGRLVPQLEREGSEHITLPVHRKSLASLLQVLPLRRQLLALDADILHARSRVPAWIAWLAWRGMPATARPRFVTTMHGLHSVSPYSAIMARGEVVIAGSETVRRYILENYPQCPPERIHLIPEGVDPDEFPYDFQPNDRWIAEWQRDFPELEGKTVLALPGRLTRLKGHATFIELMRSLSDHPEVHGLIIGGAEAKKAAYAAELRAAVADAGLADRISFTGHRSDMREVLTRCHLVYSLSTQPETFGRTVLEALRLGRPVMGWDVGGVGEILSRCYPIGRIAAGDNAALLAATRRWLQQRDRPAPCPHFLLTDMCARTLSLYDALANRAAANASPPG
ncbi:MAG: glycosyl transferase [Moraxellaceae bacterium]|jgi:glycosyltransferase involved in cell wall biosynthesis|nr:glycosyl transferase [Moraxellaceae bacterium]